MELIKFVWELLRVKNKNKYKKLRKLKIKKNIQNK